MKKGDLLLADAITHYRSILSFGSEDLIVKEYMDNCSKTYASNKTKSHMHGLAYGFSQAIIIVIFGVLFFIGGIFMGKSFEALNMELVDATLIGDAAAMERIGTEMIEAPKAVQIAIFAMIFGVFSAGNAVAFGPDTTKAAQAAKTIFTIIATPSKIDPCDEDEVAKAKRTLH